MFTRSHLVQEVWGYDYFGGTRTVDVHVRRLRAKLGPEHEQMIGTVRNVGYKFVRPAGRTGAASRAAPSERAGARPEPGRYVGAVSAPSTVHCARPSPTRNSSPRIRALVASIAREDGRDPLSDQALTHLVVRRRSSTCWRPATATVVGYAQLDGDSLEIAAEPAAAGRAARRASRGRHVLVWSHGASVAARAVLA